MVTLELAQVAFLPDQLGVVVFAVKPALMCNVVRRAYCAASMAAFETTFVVRRSIHRNLAMKCKLLVNA